MTTTIVLEPGHGATLRRLLDELPLGAAAHVAATQHYGQDQITFRRPHDARAFEAVLLKRGIRWHEIVGASVPAKW